MAGQFLKQIQRAKEAAQAPASTPTEKPVEEMSDEELQQAGTAARRALLDAQHAELREREIARVSPAEKPQAAGLANILREKQRTKKYWR